MSHAGCFQAFGRDFYIEPASAQYANAVFQDEYQIRELRKHDVRTIVDVGAHVGSFTVLCHEWWPEAKIVAVDARVDPVTRNAMIRARVEGADGPAPGSAVRVRVPVGPPTTAVAVPASALRKGPGGDHVFVIEAGPDGKSRAKSKPVVAGSMVGDEVLIVDGLKAGETVAAAGSFKLRDGLLVVPAEGK